MKDKLEINSINKNGYGSVPQLVMCDPNLQIQTKGIYAYFCSFTGKGDGDFPTVSEIVADLKISRETLTKHIKILCEYGLMEVEQDRSQKGNFAKNIYRLIEKHNQPYHKKADTVAIDTEKGSNGEKSINTRFEPIGIISDTAKPYKENSDTVDIELNNNIYNNYNNKLNNNNYIYNTDRQTDSNIDRHIQTKKVSPQTFDNLEKPTSNNPTYNYITTKALIQENIQYQTYIDEVKFFETTFDDIGLSSAKEKLAIIDEFVSIMLDTIFSKSDIMIRKELKSKEIVAGKFLEMDHDRIEMAYHNFINTSQRITDKFRFTRSMLYITCLEYNSDIKNFVNTAHSGGAE